MMTLTDLGIARGTGPPTTAGPARSNCQRAEGGGGTSPSDKVSIQRNMHVHCIHSDDIRHLSMMPILFRNIIVESAHTHTHKKTGEARSPSTRAGSASHLTVAVQVGNIPNGMQLPCTYVPRYIQYVLATIITSSKQTTTGESGVPGSAIEKSPRQSRQREGGGGGCVEIRVPS